MYLRSRALIVSLVTLPPRSTFIKKEGYFGKETVNEPLNTKKRGQNALSLELMLSTYQRCRIGNCHSPTMS